MYYYVLSPTIPDRRRWEESLLRPTLIGNVWNDRMAKVHDISRNMLENTSPRTAGPNPYAPRQTISSVQACQITPRTGPNYIPYGMYLVSDSSSQHKSSGEAYHPKDARRNAETIPRDARLDGRTAQTWQRTQLEPCVVSVYRDPDAAIQ